MQETRKLEGVQYIRITGAAGRVGRLTITNLNELSDEEITTALSTLCDYCHRMERRLNEVHGHAKDLPCDVCDVWPTLVPLSECTGPT